MCCFWNTRSASSWCFILQYKFDTCIKKKKKKKTDQYTSSFKWKIQKCPWKFSKVPPLNTFYFYAKSKFYLSCTHQRLHLSQLQSSSIASEDHQFRRDLPSSRWKMLKIVSPSHCFQPPTPEVFSPLPTPNVARRSSLSFFFFFIFFFFFSKFFFLQRCVLCFKKLTYTFICLIKCFSEDDCANNFF